jgi:hypothetical protein
LGNHEPIFGHVLHHLGLATNAELTEVLTLHLDLMQLFLKFYLLLLLGRETRSIVTAARGWRSDEDLWLIWWAHQAAILALMKLVGVAILP